MNTPLIGPCEGDCGPDHRGRIRPCYPVSGRWLCHDCIQARQAETAARLEAADQRALTDGGDRA